MPVATDTPRVWIGCLAAYNAGTLHGKWVDAVDLEELEAALDEVLKSSPIVNAEEFALMDREGFGDLIGEYTQLERVAELGAAIEEHGAAFLAYCADVLGSAYIEAAQADIGEMVDQFEEAYCGEWDSLKDYAYEYVDSCGWAGLESIPDELEPYIDWDAIGHALNEDHVYSGGFVFRSV